MTSAAGVWQLEPDLRIQWTGTEGRGQHTTAPSCSSRRPILQKILTEARRKSTNNANTTAQPGQQQKAHNDVDAIPPHLQHNHTTQFLCGSPSTTFHTLTASPPARLCLPFHLGPPPH